MRHPLAGQDRNPGIGQPVPYRAQHLGTDAVQPVHIINHQQHRLCLRRDRQQVQHCRHHRQPRSRGLRIALQHRREHRANPLVQLGDELLEAEH